MEAVEFLDCLFRDKPPNSYILIWTLQDHRSAWFLDVGVAAEYATSKASYDVYVGVGVAQKEYGAYQRCPADEVAGIVGLWLDVDFADPVHKKPNLAPTDLDALTLVDSFQFPASLIVHSGHGIQAWWLFREPWTFEELDERVEAQEFLRRWAGTWREWAGQRGWDIDATSDLARVMRIPGTRNLKGEPTDVRLLRQTEHRYNPEDISEVLLDIPPAQPYAAIAELDLNPNAEPPFSKFEALREVEPKFKQAWEHRRRDMQDQSASAYDMSLASQAAAAGWTDQEIANLLIAHRRKHGEDPKLRQDYYARTIAKARQPMELQAAADTLDDVRETTISTESQRETVLQALSKLLGIELRRIVRYIGQRQGRSEGAPTYRLETTGGSLTLGGVENIIVQANFRKFIAALTGIVVPQSKGAVWDKRAQALLDACETVDAGEDATETGPLESWLRSYLHDNLRQDTRRWEEAAMARQPFMRDGDPHIIIGEFRWWVAMSRMERLPVRTIAGLLRTIGATPYLLRVGEQVMRVWRLPQHYLT